MAKRVFKASLSVNSIKQLQKDLTAYRDGLTDKCRLLAERLAEKGVEIAKIMIVDLDAVFTRELYDSLHSEHEKDTPYGAVFAVVTDSKHCAFVEFGTGQFGEDMPYPFPLPDGVSWDYNVGKTIRQNSKTGRYYWFYPGKDGKWHYTEGMPARPFMYLTSLELQNEIVKIAKEIFGGK